MHAEAKCVLAVDLGGTKVEAALVSSDGTLVPGTRFREPTGIGRGSIELAGSVDAVTKRALAALPDGAQLIGAGIGSAGPVTLPDGTVSPLNLTAWRGYPLRAQIEALVPDVPVTLRGDGLCITLAEHWIGAARGSDNVLGMIVSTGVGGGLILGGRAVPGPTGNAGHIGHIEVAGFDDPCPCGGQGCLETIASGPGSVRWARERGFTGETGEELASAYADGNAVAMQAVHRAGRAIGQAIASASSLVDLDVVVIGGGFSHVAPDLFDVIRESVASRAAFEYVRRVKIVAAGTSTEGPLVGAAALRHRPHVIDEQGQPQSRRAQRLERNEPAPARKEVRS
ncbi:ROK family protein [Dactylosporangium sp. CA-233914]|uniref:ROK family protein n=1 Tax=Dactylosporangium sp. CA-233914 TaxID=3239934 RepID=UPI003D8C7C8F